MLLLAKNGETVCAEVPPRPSEQMVRQLFERELVKRRIEADRGKKRDGGTAETSGKRQKTSGMLVSLVLSTILVPYQLTFDQFPYPTLLVSQFFCQ